MQNAFVLVRLFDGEWNLHNLPHGLSLASIMTIRHSISAPFVGCGWVLCPTVGLVDPKELLK